MQVNPGDVITAGADNRAIVIEVYENDGPVYVLILHENDVPSLHKFESATTMFGYGWQVAEHRELEAAHYAVYCGLLFYEEEFEKELEEEC